MTEATDKRPQPQYGEYAPEHEQVAAASTDSTSGESAAAQPLPAAAAPAPGSPELIASAAPPLAKSTGPLPGVPHNLGTNNTGAARGAQAPQQDSQPVNTSAASKQDSYRAAPPVLPPAGPSTPDASPGQQPTTHAADHAPHEHNAAPSPKRRDRPATIILLVLGAIGAVYSAASIYQLATSLQLMASALDISSFIVPASVATASTVGAIIVLALYAFSLIFTLQLMRRAKLSFWVPLVAGVVSIIVVFAISSFAIAQTPELMTAFSDPDALQKLMEYLSAQAS